jgi:hypothetical protein
MPTSAEVKAELGKRVAIVSTPEFLERWVRPHLGFELDGPARWEARIVQLDGTGAATVELRGEDGLRLFAKLYPDDSGLAIFTKLLDLRAAGLGYGQRYQAVEPVAFFPEYGMLVTRAAEGTAVSEHVDADDETLLHGVREAALWLARLHTLPVRLGAPQSLLSSGELLSLARRLVKVVIDRPGHKKLALEMVRALEETAESTQEGLLVQCHGQYRPIHVFVSDSRVTVIDLDRSRPCDPSRDVAEFVHRLRMTMFWHVGRVDRADAPTAAFLETYLQAVPDRSYLANLRFHWARYVFHSLNNKLKDSSEDKCDASDLEATVDFYRSEFYNALSGRLLP